MNNNDITRDTEFLAELLVDKGIGTGSAEQCKTEVGKRALDILWKFETFPKAISLEEISTLARSDKSQIGQPEQYLAHLAATADIFECMARTLHKKHPNLDLPGPESCYSAGLVHDLSATFSDYAKGGQQSKEADQYFLAKRVGYTRNAAHVALHSVYLEGLKLMKNGAVFPKQEAYEGMIAVLRGAGPLSYEAIEQEFRETVQGKENLPLIVLSVADYMALPGTRFDPLTMDRDFEARSDDIMERYYHQAVREGKTPPLLGQALVGENGLEKIIRYKNIVKALLENTTGAATEILGRPKFLRM